MDPIFQNFLNSLPPSSPVDPTATRSYQQLGRQFADVLQRQVPGSFQGAGIQNLPTNLVTEASRIAEMPSGAAREAARNQLVNRLRIQANLQGQPPRISGMGPGGALRAPSVPFGSLNRGIGFTVNPSSAYPGSPYALDSALRRQFGITDLSRQLRAGATPSFPLDNPLTKLKGNARYLLRQGQGLKIPGLNPGTALTATRQGGSRVLPVLNAAGIAYDVYDATQTGRDPFRTGVKGVVQLGGGLLGGSAGGLVGLPTTGPGGVATAVIGYGLGSTSAGTLFDMIWPEANTPTPTGSAAFNQAASQAGALSLVPPVVQPEVEPETEIEIQPKIQPEINTSVPPVGNIGALTGNALYKAAGEAGYDNLGNLGLSQWANYYQGRLPQATSTLAATVESEEAKARKFLDTYLKKGDQ